MSVKLIELSENEREQL